MVKYLIKDTKKSLVFIINNLFLLDKILIVIDLRKR